MLACRSLIARASRFTRPPIPCATGSPLRYLHQGSIGQNKLGSFVMEGAERTSNNRTKYKRRKSPIQRWRPVSTEAMAQKDDVKNSRMEQVMENAANDSLASGVIEVSTNDASSSENNIGLESSSTKVVIEDNVEISCFNKGLDGSDISERYSSSIEVDAPLMPFVKGKGGSMQKQSEEETGVKIIFPSSKEDTCVVLEGTSAESIRKASEKITNVVEQAIQSPKLDFSHFISLPLAIHLDLVDKLNHFQRSILSEGSHVDFAIDKSIFIKPTTFHLTVLMLKLWNKDRITKASDVLQSISSQVNEALGNRPISIQLKGLTCMKGYPAKARVVYAPVLEVGGQERLERACKIIIDAFVKSGLVLWRDAKQELKLHATVMNVRHRKSKQNNRWNDSFDARDIFRKYGNEEWGEYHIPEVHLSQRFKFDESGYYHCISSIPLPAEKQKE